MKIKRKAFTEETKDLFIWIAYECYECGKNTASASHHILIGVPEHLSNSPYNLARLCNDECHINRRKEMKPLHGFEIQSKFLKKTKKILDEQDYKPTAIDREFLSKYKKYY